MLPAAHRPAVAERPHRKHRKRQTAAAATATGGGAAQAPPAGRSVVAGAPDDPATPHHHAQENTLGRRALSRGPGVSGGRARRGWVPCGPPRRTAEPPSPGRRRARGGTPPPRRGGAWDIPCSKSLGRRRPAPRAPPGRRGGRRPGRQATARLSRTTGLSVRRISSSYHSTICIQSVSSEVGASAWSWVDDFGEDRRSPGNVAVCEDEQGPHQGGRPRRVGADLAEPAPALLPTPHAKDPCTTGT
ncbi:hypothetical protein QFZ24_000029 [Streptomyces phaeochromogenes]|nr:hypothetical protein [Streptomyces phaeochromogenes]